MSTSEDIAVTVQQAARSGDTGAFVRGYFLALESQGIQAASLHGWQQGFDDELSDVDFVLSYDGFDRLVEVVANYVEESGWRLCQVLRHESTAAFCVCSWSGAPSRVVALDACSDYRRLERVLIREEDLIANREQLDWGGYRLEEAMELKYRFIKGAIKGKKAVDLVKDFANYSDKAREELQDWLSSRWQVILKSWDASDIDSAWKELERRTLEDPVVGKFNKFKRIFWRVTRPTGLVLVNASDEQSAAVKGVFQRLYFRRNSEAESFKLQGFKKLVSSTLMRCKKINFLSKMLLGKRMVLEASSSESSDELVQRVALHLQDRCIARERITLKNQ